MMVPTMNNSPMNCKMMIGGMPIIVNDVAHRQDDEAYYFEFDFALDVESEFFPDLSHLSREKLEELKGKLANALQDIFIQQLEKESDGRIKGVPVNDGNR